jgi:hypothetical protein
MGPTLHVNMCAGIPIYGTIMGQLGMIMVEVIMLIRGETTLT